MNSQFWNNVSPWQWGLLVGAYPADDHTLMFQCTNSPFSNLETFNLFAYSLAWQGEWDIYNSYWSVNMWEYDKGKFVKALNLGNRFYAGDFTFDLDYSTRCTSLSTAFCDDFTLTFMPSYECDRVRAFAKVGFEKLSECTYISPIDYTDDTIVSGNNLFCGAGVEFFPLKSNKDLRIHAMWAANSLLENERLHYLNIGLTWKLNLTQAGKALLNRIKKQ